jgi:threonine/homoserine/homoserine lactone efflux protein
MSEHQLGGFFPVGRAVTGHKENPSNYSIFERGFKMKLNQPKVVTWWIAVGLGAVGLIANFVAIPVLSALSFWLVLAGLVLLVLATYLKGL